VLCLSLDWGHISLIHSVSYNWTRIPIRGQGPKACFQHTMATIGKKLFVFGGRGSKGTLVNNSELWAFDFTKSTYCNSNRCSIVSSLTLVVVATSPTWEIIEPSSRERADPRAGHTCISYQDQLIMSVKPLCSISSILNALFYVALVVRQMIPMVPGKISTISGHLM
jgi:hypothetical protein